MSVNVSFSGVTYAIPNVAGESGWTNLTDYLVALANNAATQGSLKQAIRVATSSPVTVTATDCTVVTDLGTPGAVAVALPAGVTKQVLIIVDGKGDAATNNVTITGNGGQLINGAATYVIAIGRGGVMLQFDGTEWRVLSAFYGANPAFTSLTLTTLTVTGTATVGTLAATTATVGGATVVTDTATQTLTNKTLTAPAISSPTGLVKGDVGLGNVDNTSDATKNAAVATLTNKTLTAPVINSPTGLVKADVGLGNADDTSDATKNAAVATLTNKTISGADNTLSNIPTTALANGALPAGVTVASANIVDGTIVDADISGSAAIALSKLATGALPTAITVASANIVDGTIVDADINASAAIARSKVATGTADHVVINSGAGALSSEAQLNRTRGGTGISSTATFPSSGTIVTRDATESLTNKTLDDTSNVVLKGGNDVGNAAVTVGNSNAGSLARLTLRANAASVANVWGGSAAASVGDIDFLGTSGVKLPAGTAAQRPSSPSAGHIRFNSDSNEFEGYANGAWASVGGGVNEQPLKNYLKTYATASVGLGTVSNGTVSATGNRTTDTTLWASTNTTDLTAAQSSSTSLRGSFNYLTSGSGNSATGGTFLETPVFTLEGSDLGKPVSISFDVAGNTTSGDWDVAVVRYNSSGTYQETIPVAGTASTATVASARIPTGTAQFRGFFVAGSTSTDRYVLRFRRLANAVNIRLDTLYVGPQVQLAGAPVTDWQEYTPTFGAGWGTTTSVSFQWRRVGDSLEVRGRFTTGTVSAASSSIGLPSGLAAPSSAQNQIHGISTTSYAGAAGNYNGALVFMPSGSTTSVSLSNVGDGSTSKNLSALNVNAVIPSSTVVSVRFTVPIDTWSSNVTMSERAVEEYAFNTNTATGGDTTSFGYGASGSLVPSITQSVGATQSVYRCRFQSPIQPTDSIILEVRNGAAGQWIPVSNYSSLVSPFSYNNTRWYGVYLDRVSGSTTDVDVKFGTSGALLLGAYGSATAGDYTTWPTQNAGGVSYRVRKVSGGASVGYPIDRTNLTYAGVGNGMFYEEGTFTGTLTGLTTSPTVTIQYVRNGRLVVFYVPGQTGTSNTTAFTVTGIPAALRPTFAQNNTTRVLNNGVAVTGLVEITTGGVLEFYTSSNADSFASSGTKGTARTTLTYVLS